MRVSSQRLPESQVLLEIEVDPEQMERSLDRAYRRLVQQVEVPGFRKGKTPRNMLERHVGRHRLVHEAIDLLIPEVYNKALDDEEIDPIDQPAIEVTQEEPLAFKATVPIRPTVDLGDYSRVRVEREAAQADEADVDKSLDELRRRYAVHEPVERPVQSGDIVRADVRVVLDDREVFKDDDAEFRLRDGTTVLLPGFAEGIVGAEKGAGREIPVSVPEGQGTLSGKNGIVAVTVKEVKQEMLPEPNDEFAQQVGEGFATLEALRDRLRNDIREKLEAQAEESYRDKALGALVENARTIEFPPVLVDREIERFIRDEARNLGQDLESYLELIKKTGRDLQEELRPSATERVKGSLVLSELSQREEITVEASEVDEEIEKIVGASGQQGEQLRKLFDSPEARSSIERSLMTRKTFERLAEIAGSAEPAAKKSRAQKKAKALVKEEAK